MKTTDAVVVGGGLVGASLAYELSASGSSVILVDARREGRASDAGAGIVSPESHADPDPLWYEFARAAASHLLSTADRLSDEGADVGSQTVARCGSLTVALAEHEDPWFSSVAQLAASRDSGVTEVAPSDAQAMFPPLAEVWRALHNPSAARVDGRHLTAALTQAAIARGAAMVEADVLGVEHSGSRTRAVRTTDGSFACGALALAGGAWSGEWAGRLGVSVPVTPTKGQIVHVTSPAEAHFTSGSWPIVQPVLNFYLVPWPGGRVACGGTFEAGAGFDTRTTAAGLRDLLRELVVIAPGLAQATFTEARVGLRPTSADDRPLLGAVPGWDNVHVCTGHGANGLMLGPYSGALVARAMLGATDPVPPWCEVGRFSAA